MIKVTVKHLTKDEMKVCNSLLNSVPNINSCLYQTIEKNVFEFIQSKEALIIAEKRLIEFKNNESLKNQLNAWLEKATSRFNKAQLALNN